MTSTVSQVDEIRVTDQSSLFGNWRKGSRFEIIIFFLVYFYFIFINTEVGWFLLSLTFLLIISDLVECTGRSCVKYSDPTRSLPDQNKIWILNCGSLDRFTADGSV